MSNELIKMAETLRSARSEAGLTQPQLSALTGCQAQHEHTETCVKPIAQANISRYERGELNPTSTTVDRLLAAIATHMGRTPSAVQVTTGKLGVIGRTQGKLVAVGSLMQQTVPVDWLAENYLARGYVTMIAGQAGAGKSMHCHTLAVGFANGADEAAGLQLCGKQLRGWIIDAENVMVYDAANMGYNANLLVSRLQGIGVTEGNEQMIQAFGAAGFDIEKDFDALEASVADAQASDEPIDYIILDSWKTLWAGSENAPESVTRCLNLLNRLAAKHNIGVLVIHHAGKDGETVRGSSAIEATIAAVFTFAKVASAGSTQEDDEENDSTTHSKVRRLHCQKLRLAPEPDDLFGFMSGHGILSEPCDCEDCNPQD